LTLPPGRRYISGVVERFRNEIKTARKIRHKNVIDAPGFDSKGHILSTYPM
jgi:peptide subunit release factor 1 (eRF1)